MSVDLASMLATARENGVQARVPFPDPAPTMAEAYAIQERANAIYADELVGWKCGATNEGARRALGLQDSFIGPVPKRALRGDGATIPFTETIGAIEPELAFKLKSDLAGDASVDEVRAAIGSVHLAIEVIGRCVVGPGFETGLGLTLDFAGNAFLVLGPEVADWEGRDLSSIAVSVERDGETVQSGSTANVMGDPLASLAWAAKRLEQDGKSLRAGDWVSTGTCTTAVPAAAGTHLEAKFDGLGSVSVRFG